MRGVSTTAGKAGFGALLVTAVLGCNGEPLRKQAAAPEAPYATAAEAAELLASPGRPVVLEFCVPVGCYRCDEMRPQINALAEAEADRLTVRRVDLNAERQLAAQWGVRVCPTYVVLAGGREVGRAEYPTSAGLIAAMVPVESALE